MTMNTNNFLQINRYFSIFFEMQATYIIR